MGKVEDMRALREKIRAIEQRPVKTMAEPRPRAVVVEEVVHDLCGHTGVGGKRCIRAKDHTEKSHRYPKAAKP